MIQLAGAHGASSAHEHATAACIFDKIPGEAQGALL